MSVLGHGSIGHWALGHPPITEITLTASVGSFAFTGNAATFTITEAASVGAFALTGVAQSLTVGTVLFPDGPAAFTLTGSNANLVRTGDDYEFKLGGVGHYKLEIERAKQLARITRNPPPPIDTRTAPQFAPLAGPSSAPQAPAVDMAAAQQQRMAAQMAAAQAAKKRREAEAILLLAS